VERYRNMSNIEFKVYVSFVEGDDDVYEAVVSVFVGFKALGYHRIGQFMIHEPKLINVDELQEVLNKKVSFYNGDNNFSIRRCDDQIILGCSTSGSGNDGSIDIYLPFSSCVKFINELIAWKNEN